MDAFPEHFISLPIIVTDYDAISSPASDSSTTSSPSQTQSQATTSSATSTTSTQSWQTGFTQFADNLWSSMTNRAKQKLREACVEVLRKTDDDREQGQEWEYDEDARFLD